MKKFFAPLAFFVGCSLGIAHLSFADEPTAAYIFPAGGQRGKTVDLHVGGTFFHGRAPWQMLGAGVSATSHATETETVWFEGPQLPPPDSSRKEDYPRDHAATVTIAADAPLGTRLWRAWTSQGATDNRPFIVGDLSEVVEQETETGLEPMPVTLPVTVNGRVFPREEIDVWSFNAEAGQEITCAVLARQLGSKIETRLEVRDPQGNVIAESIDTAGADPTIRFRAATQGNYQVRIFDANFEGMQDFVYRLTLTAGPYVDNVYPLGGKRGTEVTFHAAGQGLPDTLSYKLPEGDASSVDASWTLAGTTTNRVTLAVDNLLEALEAEPNEAAATATPFTLPAILNGRIDKSGDLDQWSFTAEKGAIIIFELRATQLGSRLDSVLTIQDEAGKVLAQNDDRSGNETDSLLTFTAPEAGRYLVQIHERFASRGGADFGYRLRAEPVVATAAPDFRIQLADDVITLFRSLPAGPDGKPTVYQPQRRRLKAPTVKVDIQRMNNFAEEIELIVEGLPAGVTVTGNKLGKNVNTTNLNFSADYAAKIDIAQLKIRGEAKVGETTISRTAEYPRRLGAAVDHLLLAVALDAPFRVYGEFSMSFGAAGSIYEKTYNVERFGYEGPLVVRLSDRQMRHLQGVTGPTMTIPPGEASFVYPVSLAPGMNLGRTSRTLIMASATVKDHDGTEHVVSYHSDHQNEQVVAVLKPGLLTVTLPEPHLRIQPGGVAVLSMKLDRAESLLNRQVQIELVVPAGVKGITAEPQVHMGGNGTVLLPINFAADVVVPEFPVIVRATTMDGDKPYRAEAKLEILPAAAR
jgi:hypothetical protein